MAGREDLTFYVSGERRWQRDRSPTTLSDEFKNELKTNTLGSTLVDSNGDPFPELQGRSLNDAFKPVELELRVHAQGKVSWQLGDNITLKAGGLGSQENWQQYVHTYLYDLGHSPRYEDRNQSYYVTGNHVLNTKSFYSVGFNFFQTLRKRGDGLAFDRLTEYYRDPNPLFDTNLPLFWEPGHVFDDYLQRKSSYWGVQGNCTTQLNHYNQFKVGGDFQRHTLRYFDHYFPVQLGGSRPNLDDYDAYGYDLVVDRDPAETSRTSASMKNNHSSESDGPKHPTTWSLFGQDKFEYEGVIVNGASASTTSTSTRRRWRRSSSRSGIRMRSAICRTRSRART